MEMTAEGEQGKCGVRWAQDVNLVLLTIGGNDGEDDGSPILMSGMTEGEEDGDDGRRE